MPPEAMETAREEFLKKSEEKAKKFNVSPEEYIQQYAKTEDDVRKENGSDSESFELTAPGGKNTDNALHVATQTRIALEHAQLDEITGLPNRKSYQEELKKRQERIQKSQELQRRHPAHSLEQDPDKYSVIYLDIDHFKKVNDTYGHPKGDEVIRTVANIIKETVRSEDFAARIGGEEFSIIVAGSDINAAILVAERIQSAVKEHVFNTESTPEKESGKFKITISLGVSDYINDTDKHVTAADAALQAAKGNTSACEKTLNTSGIQLQEGQTIPQEADSRDQIWVAKNGILSKHSQKNNL